MELYPHVPICFHGVVLKYAEGRFTLFIPTDNFVAVGLYMCSAAKNHKMSPVSSAAVLAYPTAHSSADLPDSLLLANASQKYRVIHKSLRDFRTRLRNNQDRHGRKEHINR